MREIRWGSAAAIALLALLAVAPPALAVQRFASPTGLASGLCTTPATACNLQRAVEDVTADGDEVIVGPGTYVESDPVAVSNIIDVHGAAGQPRPVIVTSASSGVFASNLFARVADLEIQHSAASGLGLFVGGGVAERIVVKSTGDFSKACVPLDGGVIRDSVCWDTGASGAGAALDVVGGSSTGKLRNVTAVATGASSVGVRASSTGAFSSIVDAANVVADGALADVAVSTTVAGGSATLALTNSNYATESQTGPGTESATDPGSGANQTSPPSFANAVAGDFHQVAGSPTIDAGTPGASSLGALDVDGDPRLVDAAPDIGADEFVPVPPGADTDPPETTIVKGPKSKTKKRKAKFEFAADEPGSTFQCKLDKGDFEPCDPAETFKVKRKKHTLEVRAIDAAGNVDPTPATDSWKVKKK
ncbi:MAG TPA: choice-of-anchor Q domain-containing protein [Solirubrobacterales bacterium]|nr:choice-of-anchor Q domain-containing protein [Solirubrobacterales bacterium]